MCVTSHHILCTIMVKSKIALLFVVIIGVGLMIQPYGSFAQSSLDAPVLLYPVDEVMPAGPRDFTITFSVVPGAVSYSIEYYALNSINNTWDNSVITSGLDSPAVDYYAVKDGFFAWRAWAIDSSGVQGKKSSWGYYSLGKTQAKPSDAGVPGQISDSASQVPEDGDIILKSVKNPVLTKKGYEFSVTIKSTFKSAQSVEITSHCGVSQKEPKEPVQFDTAWTVLPQPSGTKKHKFLYPLKPEDIALVRKAPKKSNAITCSFQLGGKGSNETDYSNNEKTLELQWKGKKLKIKREIIWENMTE